MQCSAAFLSCEICHKVNEDVLFVTGQGIAPWMVGLMQSIAGIFAGIDLKFSNMCLLGTGENVQPYPAGAYGSKAVDLLVPDCLAGRYAFPAVTHPYLDLGGVPVPGRKVDAELRSAPR